MDVISKLDKNAITNCILNEAGKSERVGKIWGMDAWKRKNIKIVKLRKITFLNNKNRDELKDKKISVSNKEKSG